MNTTIPQASPAPAEPALFKTGIPGIIEYWSQGCYREYGWSWWVSVVTWWSRIRRYRLAITVVR